MDSRKTPDTSPSEVGKITYYAHVQNPSSPSLRKKRVFLTVVSNDDQETLARQGLAFLRQCRIRRLCQEAREQGTLLAYEDLVHLLLTSMSTLKRDLRLLKREGLAVEIYRKKQRLKRGN
jgi:hypothetical protein